MIYENFIKIGLIALIFLVMAFVPSIRPHYRTIASAIAMGLSAILALAAHDLKKAYVDYGSDVVKYLPYAEEGQDTVIMPSLCWLMFILAFLMLIVNCLYTYTELDFNSLKNIGKREPGWKKRKHERQNNTGVER